MGYCVHRQWHCVSVTCIVLGYPISGSINQQEDRREHRDRIAKIANTNKALVRPCWPGFLEPTNLRLLVHFRLHTRAKLLKLKVKCMLHMVILMRVLFELSLISPFENGASLSSVNVTDHVITLFPVPVSSSCLQFLSPNIRSRFTI